MAKHPKRPRDTNQLAKYIVDLATGEVEDKSQNENKKAISGRLGGKRGGPARANSLNAEKRSAIAKKAAKARWKKRLG